MCREVEKLVLEERAENTLSALRSIIEEFSVSADDALRILKIPEADKETYRKLLNQ